MKGIQAKQANKIIRNVVGMVGIGIAVGLSIGSASGASTQVSRKPIEPIPTSGYHLFGQWISTAHMMTGSENTSDFLDLVDIDALHVNFLEVDGAEMTAALDVLSAVTRNAVTSDSVIGVILYTSQNGTSIDAIDQVTTHAYSVLSYESGVLDHAYFEQESGIFTNVDSLSLTLDGPVEMDTVRSLQFASSGGILNESSIFVIENPNDEFSGNYSENPPDTILSSALILDSERNSGMVLAGISYDGIFEHFYGSEAVGAQHCGNLEKCEKGTQTCNILKGAICNKPSGGCAATSASASATTAGVDLGGEVNFSLMWSFRDNFLANYGLGQEYVTYYYYFSHRAKMDLNTLELYSTVLPMSYTAMEALLEESGDPVIVDDALYDAANAVVAAHRDIEDSTLQEILDQVESDLTAFHGMKKSALIDGLSGSVEQIEEAPVMVY